MNYYTQSADKQLNKLAEFRQGAYGCLGKARDALFELGDAVLTTPSAPSLAHLSLSPLFRRKWPSVYEAVQDATPDTGALLQLYSSQVHHSVYKTLSTKRVLLAGDNTAWPRPLARTLSERTYVHQNPPLPGMGGKPVSAGHSYSTVAWIPQEEGSWALPLLHERITPIENALDKAATQLQRVRECLPAEVEVLAMYDSAYGCAPFLRATASIQCDKIVRLRPNLRLFEPPPPYRGRGPYPKHGSPFKLKDPSTWGQSNGNGDGDGDGDGDGNGNGDGDGDGDGNGDEVLRVRVDEDDNEGQGAGGQVMVQVWHSLHFRASPSQTMSIIRISRSAAKGTRRDPKAVWLAWVGFEGRKPPPLQEWWRLYGRRFALEHWYRFAKQRLHWTTPALSTPKQGEVWSELAPLVSWELWLASGVVADCPLPWQKPQPPLKLTPGRIAAGMGAIIAVIGTPARVPKVRGKSSGWPKGRPRNKRERCPVLKKEKKGAKKGRASPKRAA